MAVEAPVTALSSQPERSRSTTLRVAVLAVAVMPPLTQAVWFVGHPQRDWPLNFADDAFYYLGVARNVAAGHGSTFSGLVHTNGYHPLWLLLLAGAALVVRDAYDLLAAVMVIQAVLWVAAVGQAMAIGRRLGSEAAALAGLVAFGTLTVLTGQLSFAGMESAPLVLALLVAVRLILALPAGDDHRGEWTLGIVLAVVALVRLDATPTALALAVVAAARPGTAPGTRPTRYGRLVGPLAAGLAVYMAFNQAVFGTATPVSGQAKAIGAPFANLRPVRQFLQAGQIGPHPLWIGALTLGVLAAAGALGAPRLDPTSRRLWGCALAFLAAQAVLLAYLVMASGYPVWAWYHYNLALLAFCATTLAALAIIRRPEPGRLARRAQGACVAGALAFAAVQMPVTLLSHTNHGPQAVLTARFLAERLPPGTVVAMGDRAGLVGYLADRPMLQLEGLVADKSWLDALRTGTEPAAIARAGVTVYVRAGFLPRPVPGPNGRPCRHMLEPKNSEGPRFVLVVCDDDLLFSAGAGGESFSVFRYRPELNRSPR